MRTCTSCRNEKPATTEFFNPTTANKWGITTWCRSCRRDHVRSRYQTNPEARRRQIAHATTRNRAMTPEQKQRRLPLYSAAMARRRARERACFGGHKPSDARRVYKEQMGCCLYCFEPIAFKDAHVDHYIPLAQGGRNDPFNLAIACAGCNLSKGPKMPADFYVFRMTDSTLGVN